MLLTAVAVRVGGQSKGTEQQYQAEEEREGGQVGGSVAKGAASSRRRDVQGVAHRQETKEVMEADDN